MTRNVARETAGSAALLAVDPLPDARDEPLAMAPGEEFAIALDVCDSLNAAEANWRSFENTADMTVFQCFDWLQKWQDRIGSKRGTRPAIVVGRDGHGAILFIFPLAIEMDRGIRRLTWLGSDLCDYNGPLLAPHFGRCVGQDRFLKLWQQIRARLNAEARFRYDLIDLPKLPETVGGQRNPFLDLELLVNPSGAYVATLGRDWDSYYAERRSSATRRKERRQLRQLSEHGALRFLHSPVGDEASRTLEALFEQKSKRLARIGAEDIFKRPGYREFFRDVVMNASAGARVVRLDVGEVIAAVHLVLVFRDRCYLVVSSYHDGDFTRLGPGRALLYELLRDAMDKSLRYFDFTIGDEPYKRDWSDIQLTLFDHLSANSWRGHAALVLISAFRHAKRTIKHHPLLSRLFYAARRMAARDQEGVRTPEARSQD